MKPNCFGEPGPSVGVLAEDRKKRAKTGRHSQGSSQASPGRQADRCSHTHVARRQAAGAQSALQAWRSHAELR